MQCFNSVTGEGTGIMIFLPFFFFPFPLIKQEISYTFKFQHHKNESFIQTCFLQEDEKGRHSRGQGSVGCLLFF